MADMLDKYRGSLVGGAVGDALGYAVEFRSERQIFSEYGENGITEYALKNGKALISDDTQMTMFTATALLDGITRGKLRGIMGDFSTYMAFEYQGWYLTQTANYPVDIEENYAKYSWVMNLPEMFSHRAPGNTCLSALAAGGKGTIEKPMNNSKGCGGIMRVAPIGLYFPEGKMDIASIVKIGADCAAITHGHELGYIPAAALVHMVSLLSHNNDITLLEAVTSSVRTMQHIFNRAKYIDDFVELIELAVKLSQSGGSDLDNIHKLGEGWVAEETLAIAVYCSLRYQDDFDKAVCTAVNHNGDSDSTGTVCGNILGAYLGYNAIPQKFKTNLEFHDVLLTLADYLYNDCQMSEYSDHDDKVWLDKYVHKTYGKRG